MDFFTSLFESSGSQPWYMLESPERRGRQISKIALNEPHFLVGMSPVILSLLLWAGLGNLFLVNMQK